MSTDRRKRFGLATLEKRLGKLTVGEFLHTWRMSEELSLQALGKRLQTDLLVRLRSPIRAMHSSVRAGWQKDLMAHFTFPIRSMAASGGSCIIKMRCRLQ